MSVLTRAFAIGAIVIFLALALLELVPRLASIPSLRLEDLDPAAEQIRRANVVPHPYIAYVPTPNYRSRPGAKEQASHNALGFRGPETTWEKPPGTYRIACLGGSSTYGQGPSTNETTWPARLEHHLRAARPDRQIEVINGGCRGYSTFEIFANLAFRVLDFEPDLVIIYETINDMRCALYKQPKHDNTHWRAVWPVKAPSVLEKSYAYLTLRRYLTNYVKNQRDLGSHVIVDYDGSVDSYSWPEGKDLGFRNFHRNLENIIALAESNGARVVLGKQALRRSDIGGPSREDQLRAFEYMSEMIGSVGREHRLLVVDAQTPLEGEALRRRQAGAGDDGIFTHEVHLTDEGSDMLARTFADAILAAQLLDVRDE